MIRFFTFVTVVTSLLIGTSSTFADIVHLDNGQTFHGDVINITNSELKLRHEILGEIVLPRNRVRAILLGDPITSTPDVQPAPGTKDIAGEPKTVKDVVDRWVNKDFGLDTVKQLEAKKNAVPQATSDDVVEQLRRDGIDSDLTQQLHLMLPGFGAPQVQSYFDGRVKGLKDGSITVQDIRKDAIDARDQLRDVMEELGSDGKALQGYFSILDSFIARTAPPDETTADDAQPSDSK